MVDLTSVQTVGSASDGRSDTSVAVTVIAQYVVAVTAAHARVLPVVVIVVPVPGVGGT